MKQTFQIPTHAMPEEIMVVLSTCHTLHSTSPMEMVHRIQPIVPKAKAASWRCEVLVRELIVWRSALSQTVQREMGTGKKHIVKLLIVWMVPLLVKSRRKYMCGRRLVVTFL